MWTDAAARAVLEQLKADMAAWHTKKVGDYCLKVLSSDQDTASLLERTSRKLSLHDRGIAKAIVNAHSARGKRALAEGGAQAARLKVHSSLKPMRERAPARRARARCRWPTKPCALPWRTQRKQIGP